MYSSERSAFINSGNNVTDGNKPSYAATSPSNPIGGGGAAAAPGRGGAMTGVRGPSLSSQKYKSFHYSRVASVAEEDYFFDESTAPSSAGGSFNYNVETEDNASLEAVMLKSTARSQETGPPSSFQMIDENPNGIGNSEPSLRKGMSTLSVQHAGTDRGYGPRRLQRLVLSPPSLHMSFDVDNAPWPQQPERLTSEKPLSKSTDNVMHRLYPAAGGEDMQHLLGGPASTIGQPSSPATSRNLNTAGAGGKHPPFEIAQISAGYMRTSGAIGQFRLMTFLSVWFTIYTGIPLGSYFWTVVPYMACFSMCIDSSSNALTHRAYGALVISDCVVWTHQGVLSAPSAPIEKGSVLRMNFMRSKQNSKERERQKKEGASAASKNSFSTTTLTALFGHNHQKDSIPETATCPTSVDEPGDAVPYVGGTQSVKNFSIDGDQISPRNQTAKSQFSDKRPQLPSASSPPEDEGEHSKSHRLEYHRNLFRQRGKACDYSFGFAILGIVLMIFETELTAGGVYTKDSVYSYGMKTLIAMSTVILVILILSYHATDIRLFMLDHGCDDWRIAIRTKRMCQMTLEVIICMICPIPGDFFFTYNPGSGHPVIPAAPNDSSIPVVPSSTPPHPRVPVDIILSIPMFLRLYLICRLMLLHSKLFTDGPSRSISALNRVNITSRLVLKMMMTVSPVTVLLAFTGSFWLTAAWIMLVCERYGVHPYQQSYNGYEYDSKRYQSVVDFESPNHQSYLNSIWVVAVTSLTIGYGDIVPNTYCGRSVSIVCGIVGAGTSSLVVAVVAKKLEFSRAEKHVHNFMMDSLITKRMKNAAANVLRETWLIYKNRKLVEKVDASKIRLHQRKFLLAIYELRRTKRGRRKLDENFITVGDMAKTTSMMYEIVSEMRTRQQEMEQKILDTEKRCANIEAYIGQLQISICALPELVARKLRPPSPLR